MIFKNRDEIRKKSGIYQIKNLITNKLYIGKTINEFEERFWVHLSTLRNGKHFNSHLQRAWNKYGEENFEFSVIEICDTNVEEREIYWIDRLNTFKKGYNQTIGGDGVGGHIMSEKQKIEIGKRNRIINLGRKHSEETKLKMSKMRKGRKVSQETIEKLIATKKKNGFKQTEESKNHLSNIFAGSNSNFATVDEEYIFKVKEMIIKNKSFEEINKKYPKISKTMYKLLKTNKRWKHVVCCGWEEYCSDLEKQILIREERKNSDKKIIKEMHQNGLSNYKIAKTINRSRDFVANIIKKM